MQDPVVKHSYVRLNSSFVHLVQYGSNKNMLKFPASYATSTAANQDSSLISCSTRSALSSLSSTSKLENSSLQTISTQMGDTSRRGESKHQSKYQKKLVIFVPGNPGILGIYHDFLVLLFRMVSSYMSDKLSCANDQLNILAIGHNNFDHPDTGVQYKISEQVFLEESDLNFAERALASNYQDDPHHVELQVLNKLIILKRLLKASEHDYKLIFVGHSIGCYVILRLLQDRTLSSCHEGSILIHPALENLGLTQGGLRFSRLFAYKLDLVVRPVALVLDKLLPKIAKVALTKWFCSSNFVQNSSDLAVESVTQLVCQRTLLALIQMAKSEFKEVNDLNSEALVKPHISRLKLIYAIDDHWVNTDNRKLLRDLYPDLYMEEQARKHAFVMDPQTVMDYAFKVGLFIQDFIDNIDKID